MKLFAQPEGARFSNKYMLLFILPVCFEQLMLGGLGIADTFMVSAKLGTTALAGVALVNRIDIFAKQFFLALGQGGSVVLAQYIGAKNQKLAEHSLKSNIQNVVGIGILFMLLMMVFKKQFVMLFFGNTDTNILKISLEYFSVTALSYPFVALYYACSSLFRVMGNSKVPFVSSVVMMCINLLLKYIFIFRLDTGVTGAAFSTLLAMAFTGFGLLFMFTLKNNSVSLKNPFKPEFDLKMSARILKVSIPNGIENAMFQLGALILASLVSGMGEDAINADQIARNLCTFVLGTSTGCIALMLSVTGQCMGARDIEEAIRYKKHILNLQRVLAFGTAVVFLSVLKPLVSVFGVSGQSEIWAIQIMVIYAIFTFLLYPTSFTTASALRGAGDTKFVMFVSAASMFAFRIGFAYVLAHFFNMGVLSIWVAMVSDWMIRSIIFEIRFKHGKWKNIQVI